MPTSNHKTTTRLNKFIAGQLSLGRRAADVLIAQGAVTINGKTAELGARVNPQDTVQVRGHALRQRAEPFLYVLMDKPKGYVCSRRQQGDTPTIYSLLPPQYQHLKTVGRLDKDSSGLILLTNDGDFTHRLTHPKFAKTKVYEVTLDKPLTPPHQKLIHEPGIELPDGTSQLRLAQLQDKSGTKWRVTMHEGRNRQIRRTFAALGYEVVRLHRTQFGPWGLSGLRGERLAPIDSPQL